MIDFENQTSHAINVELFEPIRELLANKKALELIIMDDPTIKEINLQTRNIDKATDVLSFPLHAHPNHPILGSILISIDHAKDASTAFGHSIEDELRLLFVHGLLHLLGYDHEVDSGEMRKVESEIIEKFALPPSLIVRTQGD
ncbi:MAG: heat-shock protein [Sulfuricurvum sp. PC08-66]|nr:MAG: heat-shock protein [Sulfuricurvum sp. PC08-66]